MAQITAALIKELRDKTGAGMMDCKKALSESSANIEAAVDWLRTKGISKADKKASRITAEGLVAIAGDESCFVAVEINSETDFVAKNDQFQALCTDLAAISLKNEGDIDAIRTDAEAIVVNAIATIGESIRIRRAKLVKAENGIVTSYLHNAVSSNLGRIAVLVALESNADKTALNEVGKKLAMHIAATKPTSLTRDGVDAGDIERERAIFIEQARESGKPENIIEKMVEGRISKFYKEVVLLEQGFVMDPKQTVADFIAASAKELGAEITLTDYANIVLGDGIEKKVENFAEEVAKTAGKA